MTIEGAEPDVPGEPDVPVPAINAGNRLIPAIIAENKQLRTFPGEKLLPRHSLALIAVGCEPDVPVKTIKRLPTSRYDQWEDASEFTYPAAICNARIYLIRPFWA